VLRIAAAVSFALAASGAQGGITSTFDADAEGWGTLNDARDFAWDGSIGNPGGAIKATDIGSGQYWYFAASDAYEGDLSAYYGGSLSWELLGITGDQADANPAEVMIFGGGLQIGIDIDYLPTNGSWTGAEVSLFEAGWEIVSSTTGGGLSGTAVTEQQMRDVLADVTGLFIRGEFTTGGDSTALDNVVLVPGPAVAILPAGFGVLAMRRRRAQVFR